MTDKNTDPAHILVVDDDAEICQLLAAALGNAGLEVSSATSKDQAIRSARQRRPDMVIADLRLDDGSGLEVIDRLRGDLGDLPAVIITGHGDLPTLSEASRRRPVEVLYKPLDMARLRQVVGAELQRQQHSRRLQRRHARLRELTRRVNRQRKQTHKVLCQTCADLTATCRALKGQIERQETLAGYQTDLLACAGEDDIFRRLFRLFVERSGPLFGAAMLCDENAELQLVGRFGVPAPDGVNFAQALGQALTAGVLERPTVQTVDAGENLNLFPPAMHRMLIGVSLLAVPLMAGEGQLIGLVALYRKGEQPFTEDDIALAEMIAPATAAAVQSA